VGLQALRVQTKTQTMSTVSVKHLFKIFGSNTKDAFKMIENGNSKEEILEKTGCTVGINDANFEIEEGETFVIMGLSGSGKSTVLRCLNRLIEPTSGEIIIDDNNITKMNSEDLRALRRKQLSMVFQNFGLLPHRNVVSNVEYGLEISKVDKETRRKKAMDAIELVGLKGYENQMTSELSGGMQQRVGLARALANDPHIMLMDEAFSALDPLIRADMQDELLELQARMKKTIVFITHDLDEALKIGDRIAIMKDGKVVQTGTPEQILTEPADDYVTAFVQNVDRMNIITASAIMKKAEVMRTSKDGPSAAFRKMKELGISSISVIDENRVFKGMVRIEDAKRLSESKVKDLSDIIKTDIKTTKPEVPVRSLLADSVSSAYPIPVLNDEGHIKGIVKRASVMAMVEDWEPAETQAQKSGKEESDEKEASATS
jgi:glycine betaine/proline transport system ATP-binding protein